MSLYDKNTKNLQTGRDTPPFLQIFQIFAKLKHSLNILAIFPGKALCAVEARPEKAGGIFSRVTSGVLGLPERLAQQALDGHAARIFRLFRISQMPEMGFLFILQGREGKVNWDRSGKP